MKLERSDIKFPLWRKKVDSNLFSKLHTPIPNWCVKFWNIKEVFGTNTSRKNPSSEVKIRFEKTIYPGWLTYSLHKDTNYQLFLAKDIGDKLKETFIMSYLRSLEQLLRKDKILRGETKIYDKKNVMKIEEEIPFWEFIDIDFDDSNKIFTFKAHYYQKPLFPELFRQFVRSHLLKEIENKLLNKGDFKFIKENWLPRKDFKTFLERKNIIYYLIDTENKLLYIGESERTLRILHKRSYIPDWDYFRVDCLPEWLTKSQRLELERLIIRSYASVLVNSKKIITMEISNYTLVNKKIDI